MKICFIVGSFPYMDCGVGDYTNMLANALANSKNEISVITSKKANSNVKKLNIYNIIDEFNFKSIKTIINKLKEINPDIVHLQYPSHGFNKRIYTSILLPLAIKRKLKNIKLVETIHEYPEYIWRKIKMFNFKYLFFDETIFVEDIYKELFELKAKENYKNLNTNVINVGPSILKSKLNNEEKKQLKKEINLENKLIISYFGFARPSKGIENLFKALSLIDDKKINLLYIGELREDNEYEKKLLDLMDYFKIRDRVIITGYVPNSEKVADYLYISDVCVLPYKDGVKSRYTSFLAACNQNIKIITTSLENVEDEEGIYYIKPNDSKILALKIEDVIYKTDIKSNKKINDWNDIANQYMMAYNEIGLK